MSERRPPGFRFWWTDAVVLGVGAAVAALVWRPAPEAVWPIPFALLHFFLFCNVFRVRRSYELAWTGVLLLNVGGWALADRLGWAPILLAQTPVTLAVLILEMRSDRYHGIFHARLQRARPPGPGPLDAAAD